jgi:hypothetical protein
VKIVTLERSHVLAHRVRAHELDRTRGPRSKLVTTAVLDIGVQDTHGWAARLALANRQAPNAAAKLAEPPDELTPAWSTRGAPHLHRPDDLTRFAAGLWPLSDRDVITRLGSGVGKQLRDSELEPLAAWEVVVDAMAATVTEPMPKGEVSAAVTAAIPDELSAWCRGCGATHVSEMLFRETALPAGLQILPGASPLTLTPIDGWKPVAPDPGAATTIIADYLRLLGPGTIGDAANFLGTRKDDAQGVWPDALVEVEIGGRKAWVPEADLSDLRAAKTPKLVRLLAPSDPYLQTRDRGLLVPEPDRQKELWKILGNPGAVLVDGEITGTWRAKHSGPRLKISARPFATFTKAVQRAISDEAELVGTIRGATDVDLRIDAS